ncbi:podocalyxin [Elgaria multicarinata webbii]|uniref:podocalyxin n=1 Tax=Elgaria multicarinata webbii TaxID=159646 RepID=UPI002FCCF9AA
MQTGRGSGQWALEKPSSQSGSRFGGRGPITPVPERQLCGTSLSAAAARRRTKAAAGAARVSTGRGAHADAAGGASRPRRWGRLRRGGTAAEGGSAELSRPSPEPVGSALGRKRGGSPRTLWRRLEGGKGERAPRTPACPPGARQGPDPERSGCAQRGAEASVRARLSRPAMRSALQLRRRLLLLLLLLGALSCGGVDSTTPSSTVTAPPAAGTAALITVSSGVPTPSPSGTSGPLATPSAATLRPRSDASPSTPAKKLSHSTLGAVHTTSGGAPTDKASVTSNSTATMTSPQTSANTKSPSLGVATKDPVLPTASKSVRTSEMMVTLPSKKPKEPSVIPTVNSSIAPTTHEGTTTTLGGGGSADKPTGSTVSVNVATTIKSTVTAGPAPSELGPVMPPKTTTLETLIKPEGTKATGAASAVVPHTKATTPKSSITTQAPRDTPKPHDPSPDGGVGHVSSSAQSKIVCEGKMPPKDQAIILTLNTSQPCESLEDSQLKKPLLSLLCTAVKANFNQSRDDCTVKMASVADNPKKLVVIGVSVTTHSVDEELSDVLAVKRAELEKLGVSNVTYGDKPLDIDAEDRFGMPLIITIVCMAASLLLVAAIYGCCHQRLSHRKDQQRLTEELQTMENGYHDNPTLEVMETSSEMQEKKVNLNGELADSWIVPMDSLTKEDVEEEDTHL